MGDFQRSPSKVWWANESSNWLRNISSSPGSQDSGFSDTETSPNMRPKELAQNASEINQLLKQANNVQKQNLSKNIKEKISPKKSMALQFTLQTGNKAKKSSCSCIPQTPVRRFQIQVRSEPSKKFHRNSQKVNRTLFKCPPDGTGAHNHQYARDNNNSIESQQSNTSSKVTYEDSYSGLSGDDSFGLSQSAKTYPLIGDKHLHEHNRSAPGLITAYRDDEGVTSFAEGSASSSDCESELELLFPGPIGTPQHTSTPKTNPKNMIHQLGRRNENVLLQYYCERVPPVYFGNENAPVQKWSEETRAIYESECMTTLQSKTIAGELAQKVSHLAALITASIRKVLIHSQIVEKEFENFQTQNKHSGPLKQSLTGIITEFIQTYDDTNDLVEKCDELRAINSENIGELVEQLYFDWRKIQNRILTREVTKLVNELEDPRTEIHVRGTLTGITSVALRNEKLIDLFVSSGAIHILLLLCEKCDGSTVRALVLRALSTICCNTTAIRKFEKASGVQILTELLEDDSRPEPERSEAVALLAQITAPWIEDNHSVRGLQDHTKKLVKSLTRFLASTKCCQNLLLCAAALANLTTMDNKCVKYVLHQNTVKTLLDAVKKRGPRASIYLLEQVATLIANISAVMEARKQLTKDQAPAALLCFIQSVYMDEEVEKRLQQKSVIALSRLCGDRNAAEQVVELGGVDKLVRLCREKKERHDSDAVLVAALATLRKIAEVCGATVINAQDAQELVEPRLLDSFLAYSAQNESYV